MTENSQTESQNRFTSLWLTLVVVGMFGFGYALIPLYEVFCEIAGINGKGIQVVSETESRQAVDEKRVVKVEFTGAVMGGLPWEFEPAKTIEVHPGESVRITYLARNLSSSEVTGQAVPSIVPNRATRHFLKTECFCFNNQKLMPGEEKEMPLVFKVDNDLPSTVKTITLSYAFFPATGEQTAAVESATDTRG